MKMKILRPWFSLSTKVSEFLSSLLSWKVNDVEINSSFKGWDDVSHSESLIPICHVNGRIEQYKQANMKTLRFYAVTCSVVVAALYST